METNVFWPQRSFSVIGTRIYIHFLYDPLSPPVRVYHATSCPVLAYTEAIFICVMPHAYTFTHQSRLSIMRPSTLGLGLFFCGIPSMSYVSQRERQGDLYKLCLLTYLGTCNSH